LNSASSLAQIGVPLFNNGTVTVNAGTLELNAGSTATDGSYVVNSSSILDFGGGVHLLNIGTTITATFNATARFSGGTAIISRPQNITGTTQINGGIVTFENPSTTRILNLSAGERRGLGNLTVSEGIDWSGGTIGDASLTTVSSSSTLTGTANKTLGTGGAGSTRLVNNGTMTWSNGNLILNRSEVGALLTNNGTFNATNNGAINPGPSTGASGRFNNNSTFNKTGAGTTTTIAVPYAGGTTNVNGAPLPLPVTTRRPVASFS
jgi:hypothetical protein